MAFTGFTSRFKGKILAAWGFIKRLYVFDEFVIKPQIVVAAGSNSQANATVLTTPLTFITTVSATTRGLILTAPTDTLGIGGGSMQFLFNGAATNRCKVYPPVGFRIGTAATNASVYLAAQKGSLYACQDGTTTFQVMTGA